MEAEKNKKQQLSRKKFLQICGSVLAGGSIIGLTGMLFHTRQVAPDRILKKNGANTGADAFRSPYRMISSFHVPDPVEAFESAGDRLIIAASNSIYVYDRGGGLLNNFAAASNLRDITVCNDEIYLLFPTRIEVYDKEGGWLREWDACSDRSDYCSIAVAPGGVFVTDVANKNICQYAANGAFMRFIQSPDGFIIPSYSFDILYANGIIYCSNSGRHQVEKYATDGAYIGAFGRAGGADGMFCGCCNPVYLACSAAGELITSEKGNPRVSCYDTNGVFRGLLLDSKTLGGGNTAYDIKADGDLLFVAGKNKISIFRYDNTQTAKTACAACGADCPLRKGITI